MIKRKILIPTTSALAKAVLAWLLALQAPYSSNTTVWSALARIFAAKPKSILVQLQSAELSLP